MALLINNEQLTEFSATCKKCNSENISISYSFSYHGALTGFDCSICIECLDCKNEYETSV